MEEIIAKLAAFYLSALLRGSIDRSVSPSSLEPDGRKTAKLVKELLAHGYIDAGEGNDYIVTTKAYDEIVAVKPDLLSRTFERVDRYKNIDNVRVTQHDIQKCIGAPWTSLTLSEKKWVVTHPADYTVWSYNSVWGPETAKQPKVGDREAFRTLSYSPNDALYISDDAVAAERAARVYQNRFDHIRNNNLAWGLAKQGFISEDDAKLFAQRGEEGLLGDTHFLFNTVPQDWGTDIARIKQALRDRIAADLKHLNTLEFVEQAIANKGGWQKFLEQYDEDVKTVIEKE